MTALPDERTTDHSFEEWVPNTIHVFDSWEGEVAVALCGFRKLPDWTGLSPIGTTCVVCAELGA